MASSSAEQPLLPVTSPPPPPLPSPPPSPPNNSRFLKVAAKLLLLPTRVVVGGTAFIAAAAVSSHIGLSRRATAAACLGAVGASEAALFTLGAWQRRRARRRALARDRADSDRGVMDWQEALGAVRKIVDTFSDGLIAPFTLKHLLLDTELLRRHHTDVYNSQLRRPRVQSAEDALVAGRHFADFAFASYGFGLLKILGLLKDGHDLFVDGAKPIEIVLHQLQISQADIIVSGLDARQFGLPKHFVARDKSTESIVVAVRGTNSLSDVLVDLLCDCVPFANGYAHAGMRDAAQALFASILPCLRVALEENRGYSLVTCGHSLGGGVAVLLTKILLDAGFAGVKCYAVSPPPVFGPAHLVDPAWSASLECFVHGEDIVPRLSLESARALVREIEEIDGLPLSDSDLRGLSPSKLRLAIARSRTYKPKDCAEDGKERGPMSPLHIPTSHVHWIVPREKDDDVNEADSLSQYISVRAESSLFTRMLVTKKCYTSHFPSSYFTALNNLDIPPKAPWFSPRTRRRNSEAPVAATFHYDGELGF